MKLVKVSEDKTIPVFDGRTMESGGSYLCSDEFAKVIPDVEILEYDRQKFNPAEDWNNRTIWILRGGGFGDLLLLTPLLSKLKEKWPCCNIRVCSGQRYHGVFNGLDVTDDLLPLDMSQVKETDAIAPLEFESHPAARKVHMALLFARMMGVHLDSIQPTYTVTDEEYRFAGENYPKNGRKRIGVQLVASCLARSYPLINKTIRLLLDAGVEVYLFGSPGQIRFGGDGKTNEALVNLTADNLTFRQSAAALTTCDAVIAPDSSMVHLASALNVPCVAIYGPFPSQLRITSASAFIMEGKAECSPCFFHAANANDLPAGKPCEKAGHCIALAAIPPEEVARIAMEICS